NTALWSELRTLRDQNARQGELVERVVGFLRGVVGGQGRGRRLMVEDAITSREDESRWEEVEEVAGKAAKERERERVESEAVANDVEDEVRGVKRKRGNDGVPITAEAHPVFPLTPTITPLNFPPLSSISLSADSELDGELPPLEIRDSDGSGDGMVTLATRQGNVKMTKSVAGAIDYIVQKRLAALMAQYASGGGAGVTGIGSGSGRPGVFRMPAPTSSTSSATEQHNQPATLVETPGGSLEVNGQDAAAMMALYKRLPQLNGAVAVPGTGSPANDPLIGLMSNHTEAVNALSTDVESLDAKVTQLYQMLGVDMSQLPSTGWDGSISEDGASQKLHQDLSTELLPGKGNETQPSVSPPAPGQDVPSGLQSMPMSPTIGSFDISAFLNGFEMDGGHPYGDGEGMQGVKWEPGV
ncbi:hypothetical protein HDU93_005350, partial [Gonapodya sp. JEL0774]